MSQARDSVLTHAERKTWAEHRGASSQESSFSNHADMEFVFRVKLDFRHRLIFGGIEGRHLRFRRAEFPEMAAVPEAKPAPSQAGYYPERDGQPLAENTKQFQWIVTIKENLDALLTNAFVAGDLFWYPLEGNCLIRQALDVLTAAQ